MEQSELEKILGSEDQNTSANDKGEPESKETKPEEVLDKEKAELEELKAEKAKAQEELSNLRRAKFKEQKKQDFDVEEDLPKINLDDPNAKAWDKHISERVSPAMTELEREKEEVVSLALNEFLSEHPSLARNQDVRKEFMQSYDALAKGRGITERNKDVVLDTMRRAYAATSYQEILDRERAQRVSKAQAEGMLADAATDSGSTSYRKDSPRRRQLSRDETETAIKMYGSVEEYWKSFDTNAV